MAKRPVAFLLLALLTAGCASRSDDRPEAAASVRPVEVQATVTTVSSPPSPPAAPAPDALHPPAPAPRPRPAAAPAPMPLRSGEVHPGVKQVASDVARRLTTYDLASTPEEIVAPITSDPTARQGLVVAARPLYHPGRWSKGTVVYPQMGGFRTEHVSVMLVVRQEIGTGEEIELTETRTLDVRLARRGGTWVFEELASAGGEPVPRPARLAPPAVAVLDDPRIELPDSARWDIYRGRVAPALLRVMAEMAGHAPYGVVVLSSGHPHNVFATNRQSNHTRGRAVDVYRVGATRVADDRTTDSAAYHLTRRLLQRTDLSEVGSPWSLGPGSFTDTVHQDHLHIAVRSAR